MRIGTGREGRAENAVRADGSLPVRSPFTYGTACANVKCTFGGLLDEAAINILRTSHGRHGVTTGSAVRCTLITL